MYVICSYFCLFQNKFHMGVFHGMKAIDFRTVKRKLFFQIHIFKIILCGNGQPNSMLQPRRQGQMLCVAFCCCVTSPGIQPL